MRRAPKPALAPARAGALSPAGGSAALAPARAGAFPPAGGSAADTKAGGRSLTLVLTGAGDGPTVVTLTRVAEAA